MDQIQRVHKIIDQLERVLHLTDKHASLGQLSAFTFGRQALTHFVAMVITDVDNAFNNFDSFTQDYKLAYGQRRVNLLQELDGILSALISIFDIYEWKGTEANYPFATRVSALQEACTKAIDLIGVVLGEKNIDDHNQYLSYLPSLFYLSKDTQKECEETLKAVKVDVENLNTAMGNDEYTDAGTFVHASAITNKTKILENCINEVGVTLSSAKVWFKENEFAQNKIEDILDYNIYFDYNNTRAALSATVEKYQAKLQQLAEHKLTKLELAEFINADEVESIKAYLKATYDIINRQVNTIIDTAIDTVEKNSINTYNDLLGHLSNIQQYYTANNINRFFADQARRMQIFYKPYILEDSFGSLSYISNTVTDTYEIWPLNKDFKEFVEKDARAYLVTLVKTYFEPVRDAMSTAMADIESNSNAASENLKAATESLASYVKSSRIDKDFIE